MSSAVTESPATATMAVLRCTAISGSVIPTKTSVTEKPMISTASVSSFRMVEVTASRFVMRPEVMPWH